MTLQDRKEQAILHKDLIDVITKCQGDQHYLKRLLWAQEIIKNALNDFSDKEINRAISRMKWN